MLNVILGHGADYLEAIQDAVTQYNAIDGMKTWHHKESSFNKVTGSFMIEVWFTLRQPITEPPVIKTFEYIGSTNIDPNDPEWETKWKEQHREDALQGV